MPDTNTTKTDAVQAPDALTAKVAALESRIVTLEETLIGLMEGAKAHNLPNLEAAIERLIQREG